MEQTDEFKDRDSLSAALGAAVTTELSDLDENTTLITRTQDVEAILDANKEEANHVSGWSPTKEIRHVARIPFVVAELWLNVHGVDVLNPDHKPAVARLLDSNEWRYLRTGQGRLSK